MGALIAVAVSLLTSTAALAQSTITLTNTAGAADRDSGALGQATLTSVAYSNTFSQGGSCSAVFVCDVYTGVLIVSCTRLTPGATYRVGPTRVDDLRIGTKNPRKDIPPYVYVTASDNGTVELTLQVSFVGIVSEYILNGPCGSDGAYYEWYRTWYPDYGLSVARRIKHTSDYLLVLQGSFPQPADPN
jgi:hypothetical protein